MRSIFVLLCSFLMVQMAGAEVPNQLHYQGYLTNAAGDAVDCPDPIQCDDSISVTFKLYTDAFVDVGLWQESHLGLPIYQGTFHVRLGSETILDPEVLSTARWIGISINGGPEMAPRQELASAAFAMHADQAQHAETAVDATLLGGVPAAEYALPADLQDGDNDSLGDLACGIDAIPKWNGSNWYCGVDGGGEDTTLNEIQVDAMVSDNGYSMGPHTIDTDTHLTEAEVDAFVMNNGYASQAETISALSCAIGEVAQWNGSEWACAAPGGGATVGGDVPECGSSTEGSFHYDPATGKLLFCDGTIQRNVRLCDDVCSEPADVTCGTAIESGCGLSCGTVGTGLNLAQCDVSGLPCGQMAFDNCGNACGLSGTGLNLDSCPDAGANPCGAALSDPCGNVCPSGNVCNIGVCVSGECSNLNLPGSILDGSAYSGESILGYTQCAGFRNTGDWDILTTDWIHTCASDGTKKWLVRLVDANTGSVYMEDRFPSFTTSELNNNLPGCNDSGYGICGKPSTIGTGRNLLVYKPNNGNGGCHGDDNSAGAFRVSSSPDGNNMGNNFIFVGGKHPGGGTRSHNNGDQPDSEIRYMGGSEWSGCSHDGRVDYAITVYVEN